MTCKCGADKPVDGYVRCEACRGKHAAYMRQYFLLHPERNRSNVRRWRDKNPEKRRAQNRKYKSVMSRIRPLRYEYEVLKKRARKIGIREILDYVDFARLIVLPCSYCGAAPIDRGRGARNGLDRIDNERGYSLDNIATACVTCNFAKGTLTAEEFRAWVVQVVRHLGLVS